MPANELSPEAVDKLLPPSALDHLHLRRPARTAEEKAKAEDKEDSEVAEQAGLGRPRVEKAKAEDKEDSEVVEPPRPGRTASEGLRQDLENLLNALHFGLPAPADESSLLLNYGVIVAKRDRVPSAGDGVGRLAAGVADYLRRFEPRLQEIQVAPFTSSPHVSGIPARASAEFRILVVRARIAAYPESGRICIYLVVDHLGGVLALYRPALEHFFATMPPCDAVPEMK